MINLSVKQRKIIGRIILVILPLIAVSVLLFAFKCLDYDYFISESYKAVQFNVLTINSILLGFMFTSLGIFVSASEAKAIKVERDYIQYDLLVISIILGLISIGISLITNIVIIIITTDLFFKFYKPLIIIEFFSLILGILMFLFTISDTIYVVARIRGYKK